MKSVNLVSLSESLHTAVADEFLVYLECKIKPIEREIIPVFCQKIVNAGARVEDLNCFYFGYNIPQIGKEFDFLRIGHYIINIEIKSEADEDKIKKQLVRNKMYLSSLGKYVYLYSYIKDIDKLYSLTENDELIEVCFEGLFEAIHNQVDLYDGDLNNYFNPYDYLVSPFNATDDFMNDNYFLTPQQEDIVKKINFIFDSSIGNIVAIEGGAGTGKSLLLYDYAKRLRKQDNRALIVHVAKINDGHKALIQNYGFSISEIKQFMKNINNSVLNHFDVILFDEAQRLLSWQIDCILEYVKNNRINCVFTYDKKQTMSDNEARSNAIEKIEEISDSCYKLGNKIRTNILLAQFVNKMFDLRQGTIVTNAPVSLTYFADFEHAAHYLNNTQYQFIRYTPSIYNKHKIDILENINTCVGAVHEVIGQEFDNVAVLVDETFFYNQEGVLQARMINGIPYDFLGMLYQSVTRARQKLEIVIVNNPDVFKKISELLK